MVSARFSDRGPLFPGRLPTRFRRQEPAASVNELVSWWWISEWRLPPNGESPQEVLAFPASNLAVEDSRVRFWGPTTRRSTQVLRGTGWVIGALLRPAAVPLFTDSPARWRDDSFPVRLGPVYDQVAGLAESDPCDGIALLEAWLAERSGPVDTEARLANRMSELATHDPAMTTVGELASALHLSERNVYRLATRYVGLSPYAMIRRRRLQEAVAAARADPAEPLADIAVRFGFVDQAHLAREARSALGFPLQTYRRQLGGGSAGSSSG